ncbi:MAG: hypothetical protein JWR26_2985 [Pedosphaera sp.]|nr:hypothetical protein [Pedosphaera sp.]
MGSGRSLGRMLCCSSVAAPRRGCSLLTPRLQPKSLAAPSAPICERASLFRLGHRPLRACSLAKTSPQDQKSSLLIATSFLSMLPGPSVGSGVCTRPRSGTVCRPPLSRGIWPNLGVSRSVSPFSWIFFRGLEDCHHGDGFISLAARLRSEAMAGALQRKTESQQSGRTYEPVRDAIAM